MPFHPEFRAFDPKLDIVFGIDTPDRKSFLTYLTKLKILTFADWNRKGNPIFIDGFDDLNQNIGDKPSKSIPEQNRVEHRKAVLEAYPEAKLKPAQENDNLLSRKKSKGSLYWAARNNIHIHFVMYKFALPESQIMVATKTSIQGGKVGDKLGPDTGDVPKGKSTLSLTLKEQFESREYWEKYRNITASELRWIYRMRNNEKVEKFIQFWRSDDGNIFEQCSPPWEWKNWQKTDYTTIWSQYKPTMEGAYDSLLSDGSV